MNGNSKCKRPLVPHKRLVNYRAGKDGTDDEKTRDTRHDDDVTFHYYSYVAIEATMYVYALAFMRVWRRLAGAFYMRLLYAILYSLRTEAKRWRRTLIAAPRTLIIDYKYRHRQLLAVASWSSSCKHRTVYSLSTITLTSWALIVWYMCLHKLYTYYYTIVLYIVYTYTHANCTCSVRTNIYTHNLSQNVIGTRTRHNSAVAMRSPAMRCDVLSVHIRVSSLHAEFTGQWICMHSALNTAKRAEHDGDDMMANRRWEWF